MMMDDNDDNNNNDEDVTRLLEYIHNNTYTTIHRYIDRYI